MNTVKIKATISTKPVKEEFFTRIGSEKAYVEIDAIQFIYAGHYEARMVNQRRDAPHNLQAWVHFIKKDNKHVKCPVLNKQSEIWMIGDKS